MKISRVYIYLKLKNLFFSFFSNSYLSKKKLSKNLLEMTNKKYVEFFGMCRTSFIVILEFLKEKKPNKNESQQLKKTDEKKKLEVKKTDLVEKKTTIKKNPLRTKKK